MVCTYLLVKHEAVWAVVVLAGWPLYGLTWQLLPNRFTDEPGGRL